MSWTTEDERPDVCTKEYFERFPSGGPISKTRGVWVRVMNDKSVELYYDGHLQEVWGAWNEYVAVSMMDCIYQRGHRHGAEQNQKALRDALGLST